VHAGDVLKGVLEAERVPRLWTLCTPRKPLGAPMVSSEGACAATTISGGSRVAAAVALTAARLAAARNGVVLGKWAAFREEGPMTQFVLRLVVTPSRW